MPQDVRGTIVRGPLQNVSLAFRNGEYVADRIFPLLDVESPKVKLWKWDEGAMFRNEAKKRGPGGETPFSQYTGDWVDINVYEYAFGTKITDEDRDNAELNSTPPMELENDAMEYMANMLDLNREIKVASTILTSTWADGTGAGGEDAAGLWAATDSTNTLLVDVNTAKRAFHGNVGAVPGLKYKMIIDEVGYHGVLQALSISDVFKYTGKGGAPDKAWLQNYLGLDEILVGTARYDTGAEKKAGGKNSVSQIWQVNATKGCAFVFAAHESPKTKMVAPGLQVRVKYNESAGGAYRKITTWRDYDHKQDKYDTLEQVDFKQVYAGAGYMFKDIILT